jgi:pimeloyl-ACP methyl ester carboxylesterase
MKRALVGVVLALVALFVLPPTWFAIFPQPKPDLPPAGRRVEAAPGLGVNLIEKGAGPTVVLVHGQPGTAYEWTAVMGELAKRGHRVLAYDRAGYGRSDRRLDGDYSYNANAHELLGLLDTERLTDVTVVGFSYGGGTAIIAARKDPTRIARLVLVASVGPGIEDRDQPAKPVRDFILGPGLTWVTRVPPLSKRLRGLFVAEAFDPDPVPGDFLSLMDANFASPYTIDTFRHEGKDIGGAADFDTSTIDLPILIVQGDGDRLVPPAVAEELHRRAKGSELWRIERGSHMLPNTHSAALAERIAAFARTAPPTQN